MASRSISAEPYRRGGSASPSGYNQKEHPSLPPAPEYMSHYHNEGRAMDTPSPTPGSSRYTSFVPLDQRPPITMTLTSAASVQPSPVDYTPMSQATPLYQNYDRPISPATSHYTSYERPTSPSTGPGLTTEYASVKSAIVGLKDRNQKLETELEQARNEIRSLKVGKGKTTKAVASKLGIEPPGQREGGRSVAERETRQMRAELVEFKQNMNTSQKLQQAAESKARDSHAMAKQMQSINLQLQSERDALRSDMDIANEERRILRQQLKECKDQVKILLNAKADWEAEREQTREALRKTTEEKKQAASKAQLSDSRYREIKETFGQVRSSKESLEKEKENTERQFKELHEELRTSRERTKNADERAKQLKELCATLKKSKSTLEVENEELKKQLARADEERFPLELKKTMQTKMRKMELLIKNLTLASDRDIQKDRQDAEERRERIRHGASLESILEELEDQVSELRNSNKLLLKEREDSNHQLDKLFQEVHKTQTYYGTEESGMIEQLANVKVDRLALIEEVKELEQQREELQRTLRTWKEKFEELSDRCERDSHTIGELKQALNIAEREREFLKYSLNSKDKRPGEPSGANIGSVASAPQYAWDSTAYQEERPRSTTPATGHIYSILEETIETEKAQRYNVEKHERIARRKVAALASAGTFVKKPAQAVFYTSVGRKDEDTSYNPEREMSRLSPVRSRSPSPAAKPAAQAQFFMHSPTNRSTTKEDEAAREHEREREWAQKDREYSERRKSATSTFNKKLEFVNMQDELCSLSERIGNYMNKREY